MDRGGTPTDPELRRWVETWRAAGEALARVKRDELARLDTAECLSQLADGFEHALRHAEPTTTSGLVEQQRIFAPSARDPAIVAALAPLAEAKGAPEVLDRVESLRRESSA